MAEKTEKKSGNQIVKLALVLLAVAAIMAFVLGIVNEITKDRIAETAAEKTATAYANVLEAPTYDEATDFTNDENQTITKLSVAKNDAGETTGYVAETTFSGAQGMITMVVGLDDTYTCTGVYIRAFRDRRPRRQGGGDHRRRVARQCGRRDRGYGACQGRRHDPGHLRRDHHLPRGRQRGAVRDRGCQVAGLKEAER